ncbi:class I SAM-dependent methyltransferase [Aestuariivirga sp.]|uniref:class I SAM-dependent methyltransferase n=1 Tax=Aestuariivirga sp. TaxID=2650926 RepID=UPI00391993AB
MDLKEEAFLGVSADRHWYYVSKALMIEAHIADRARSILDVGAGSGWFSRRLLKRDLADRAICVDPGYQEDRDELVEGRSLLYRRAWEQNDADLVLLMDVLEHVDDDVALLSGYVKTARPGTRFLITVPAFEFLWSAHDEYLGHRRRYSRSQVRELVSSSGLSEVSSHYYFATILPPVAAVRLARRFVRPDRSDMKPLPGWMNAALALLLSFERTWMRANRVAGLTVVCLCEKRL